MQFYKRSVFVTSPTQGIQRNDDYVSAFGLVDMVHWLFHGVGDGACLYINQVVNTNMHLSSHLNITNSTLHSRIIIFLANNIATLTTLSKVVRCLYSPVSFRISLFDSRLFSASYLFIFAYFTYYIILIVIRFCLHNLVSSSMLLLDIKLMCHFAS